MVQREQNFLILSWDLAPGDAVAFHMLTLQRTAGITGSSRPRVFSVRLLGDDIVHAPRVWKTSPHFPGLDEELKTGTPMVHPLFPLRGRLRLPRDVD